MNERFVIPRRAVNFPITPDWCIHTCMQFRTWILTIFCKGISFDWLFSDFHAGLTNSFGNRRTPWQLQPCHRVIIKVVNVWQEFYRQCGRRFMTLKNWLVMPAGTKHFDQMSVAVIVRQGTCCYCDTLRRKENESRCKTAHINYSILLSPVVIIILDLVGQIGWPSNVTDWLIGSGTCGL